MADQRASIEIAAEVESAIANVSRLSEAFLRAADRIERSLDDVDSDELTGDLAKAERQLEELGFGAVDAGRKLDAAFDGADDDLRRTAKAADRLEQELKQAGAAGQRTKGQISGLRNAMGALTAALGGFSLARFAADAKNVAVEFDSLDKAALSVFESQEKAAEAMAFASAEAERLGKNTLSTSESFVAFSAAAKGTALEGEGSRKIFTAVNEAMTALGRSSSDTGGALLALQQTISKGKVSAEELRQQLGERLPGAFNIFAASMGVSTAELDKLLSTGKVGLETLIPFAEELTKQFGTNLAEALESDRAKLERLNNKGLEFKRVFGAAFIDDLVEGMERFAGTLGDSAESASILGNALGFLIREGLGLSNVVAGLIGVVSGAWVGALLLAARSVVGLGEAMARILPGFDGVEEGLAKSRREIELLIQASVEFVKNSGTKIKQGGADMAAGFEALGDAAAGAGAKIEEAADSVESWQEKNARLLAETKKTKIEIQGLAGSIGGVPIAAYVAETKEAAEATKDLATETKEAAEAFEDIQERIEKANEAARRLEKESEGAAGETGGLAGEVAGLETELEGLREKTFLTVEELARLDTADAELIAKKRELTEATRGASSAMTEFGAGSREASGIVDEFAESMFLTEEQLASFGEETSEAIRRQRLFGDETGQAATEQEKLAAQIEKVELALVALEERIGKSFSEGLVGADEYIGKLGEIDSLLDAIIAKLDQVK